MMCFWQNRYRMMMGRTVSMMQAIMGPISTRPKLPLKYWMRMGTVEYYFRSSTR